MAMVERRDQLDRLGQQHAIAEDVARHVAAADHLNRIALHVDAHFEEVALHADPCALGSYAHGLVVIAFRPTTGESVVEPEIPGFRDGVGNVGEFGRALVGCNHEIGIFAVGDNDAIRMHDLFIDDVVGDRQQRPDEHLVACLAFGGPALAIERRIGKLLGIEATLRAGRNDDGILHALRFHQAENLGPEIVAAVGPAQASARHWARAQVDALHAARIHEDFSPGDRLGQIGYERGIDLEGQRLVRCRSKAVRPQDCIDERVVKP